VGHRVEGVNHGDDTRSDWDLFAGESGRIAFAVPSFVVRQGNLLG
jgi:hypothetical protein